LGTLRIIGGELRGRRLKVPPGRAVRPTADRVREALFNILAPVVHDAGVLDPFAGSGALGLEALSRGARHATFIERDRAVLALLRENVEHVGAGDRAEIFAGAAERVLAGSPPRGPWDLVLADPPYATDIFPWIDVLLDRDGLAPGGRIVIERESRTAGPERLGDLSLFRSATYGGTRLDFYSI
jgi:16S rRNA (guanine966-N2)-methyltransferase